MDLPLLYDPNKIVKLFIILLYKLKYIMCICCLNTLIYTMIIIIIIIKSKANENRIKSQFNSFIFIF